MIRPRREADVSVLNWLRERDRGFAALRRAGRAALVMPAMFALGDKVIGNPTFATFAAFGSFAMLLLVDFTGPMRDRLQAQAALAVTGGVFDLPGHPGLALGVARGDRDGARRVRRAVRRRRQLGAGRSDDVAAARVHPAGLAAGTGLRDPRSAGGLGGWRRERRCSRSRCCGRRRRATRCAAAAIAGCRALAARLRAQVAYHLSGGADPSAEQRDAAIARADEAVDGAARGVLRDALPADRIEHRGPGRRAPGRRAALARPRSSCAPSPSRTSRRSIRAPAR